MLVPESFPRVSQDINVSTSTTQKIVPTSEAPTQRHAQVRSQKYYGDNAL
jgi:hypothetical protein